MPAKVARCLKKVACFRIQLGEEGRPIRLAAHRRRRYSHLRVTRECSMEGTAGRVGCGATRICVCARQNFDLFSKKLQSFEIFTTAHEPLWALTVY